MKLRTTSVAALSFVASLAFGATFPEYSGEFTQLTDSNYETSFTKSSSGFYNLNGGKWYIAEGTEVNTSFTGGAGFDIALQNSSSNILCIEGTLKHDRENAMGLLLRGGTEGQPSKNAVLDVRETGKLIINEIVLRGNLILRSENAISGATNKYTSVKVQNGNGLAASPKIEIYGNQKIKLDLTDIPGSIPLRVVFGADKELAVCEFKTSTSERTLSVLLEDFVDNGSLFLAGVTESMIDTLKSDNKIAVGSKTSFLFSITENDQSVTIDSSKWNLQSATVDGIAGCVLTYGVNIPEPAEWAAIFGCLALGLAIYRRRK